MPDGMGFLSPRCFAAANVRLRLGRASKVFLGTCLAQAVMARDSPPTPVSCDHILGTTKVYLTVTTRRLPSSNLAGSSRNRPAVLEDFGAEAARVDAQFLVDAGIAASDSRHAKPQAETSFAFRTDRRPELRRSSYGWWTAFGQRRLQGPAPGPFRSLRPRSLRWQRALALNPAPHSAPRTFRFAEISASMPSSGFLGLAWLRLTASERQEYPFERLLVARWGVA